MWNPVLWSIHNIANTLRGLAINRPSDSSLLGTVKEAVQHNSNLKSNQFTGYSFISDCFMHNGLPSKSINMCIKCLTWHQCSITNEKLYRNGGASSLNGIYCTFYWQNICNRAYNLLPMMENTNFIRVIIVVLRGCSE
jgi:hypothetical protein